MFFGEVRIDEAEGLILAHSLRLAEAMLKKGRVLTAQDVRALKEAGINFITGARLEEGDVAEDEAARLLAQALAGSGLAPQPPFFGRCNLFAAQRGVVAIDRDRLDRLNQVDEAICVATLPPFDIVAPRQLVATVKIIPFGVDRRLVKTCAALAAKGEPLLQVRPFRPLRAALILTTLPGMRDRVLTAAAATTRARLAALDGEITQELRCGHEVGALERSLVKAIAAGAEMVLVMGASATVDRRDVVPSALVRAGGTIDHFGMPVDPGNLLLLGRLGPVAVVALPGCARSLKINGLDWILRRLAAGFALKPADIMRMGPGGLLKERSTFGRGHAEAIGLPREPRIAALVVAVAADMTQLARAAEAALTAGLDPVVVVIGPSADHGDEALPTCDIQIIRAGEGDIPARLGIAALPDDVDAAVILPADAPPLDAAALRHLRAAFDPDEGRAICVPIHHGIRSAAFLIGRDHFPDIAAASLLIDHAELVYEVVIGEAASSPDREPAAVLMG